MNGQTDDHTGGCIDGRKDGCVRKCVHEQVCTWEVHQQGGVREAAGSLAKPFTWPPTEKLNAKPFTWPSTEK
eukprot:365195-Chlamydomonas_euryale.AAC.19